MTSTLHQLIQKAVTILSALLLFTATNAMLYKATLLIFPEQQAKQNITQKISATSDIIIQIINCRGRSGQVCIAVFDSEESFRNEEPLKSKKIARNNDSSDTLLLSISLATGTYGISVLDDTDADGQMKYGFGGTPCEGFGFSGYQQKGLKRPRFKYFSFRHTAGEPTRVKVKMSYLF